MNHVLMLAILLLLGFWNMDWILLGPSFVKYKEVGLHTASKRCCVLAVTAVPIQRCCRSYNGDADGGHVEAVTHKCSLALDNNVVAHVLM